MPDTRETYEQKGACMVYGPAFGPSRQSAYDRQRAAVLADMARRGQGAPEFYDRAAYARELAEAVRQSPTGRRDMENREPEYTQEQLDRELTEARNYERQGLSWDDAMEKARGGAELYGRVRQHVRRELQQQARQRQAEDDEVLTFDRQLAEARNYERQGMSWDDAVCRAGL